MSDYIKKAEEFLIEQGYPNRGIKTIHKLGGSYIVDLAHVLTQYEEYLEGLSRQQARENPDDTIDMVLGNAGAIS
jgi:predicted subunit of tRNA(5-methylaminomethyl-2-thiouridylate) methyltransferase